MFYVSVFSKGEALFDRSNIHARHGTIGDNIVVRHSVDSVGGLDRQPEVEERGTGHGASHQGGDHEDFYRDGNTHWRRHHASYSKQIAAATPA